MNILVIGDNKRAEELKLKIPKEARVNFVEVINGANPDSAEVIFDLNFDDNPSNLAVYFSMKDKPIIVSAVKKQMAEAAFSLGVKIDCKLIGMNCLPTFINRNKTEISLLNKNDKSVAEHVFKQLNWEFLLVEDRVGMVTPRIVFMIINEACYTLQEGTASVNDIDSGMKLGTNYPFGPFEWADKIGIKDVYETLIAIYEDTKDERYKICPLLKTKYLKNEKFY